MWRLEFNSFPCFRTAQSTVVFCLGTAVIAFIYFEVYWPPNSSFWSCPTMQKPTNQVNKQTSKSFFQEGQKGAWHRSAVIRILTWMAGVKICLCIFTIWGTRLKVPPLSIISKANPDFGFQLGTSLLFLNVQSETSVACSEAAPIFKTEVHTEFRCLMSQVPSAVLKPGVLIISASILLKYCQST